VHGLTSAEAAARLAAEGPNALPDARARGVLAIALGVLTRRMPAIVALDLRQPAPRRGA